MVHPDHNATLSIPDHHEVAKGTLRSLIRPASLTVDEFVAALSVRHLTSRFLESRGPMDHFHYRDGQLYCEDVPVAELAEQYGTPLYVYSQAAFLGTLEGAADGVRRGRSAGLLLGQGELEPGHPQGAWPSTAAGSTWSPAGELYRVRTGRGRRRARRSSPGWARPTRRSRAGLEAGVLMFNVESEAELDAIARVAAAVGKVAPIALRVNPDVDPKTHRYISTGKKESKFGMDIDRSLRAGRGGRGDPERVDDRHAHAHRLADHHDRALRRARWPRGSS